jgi:hypothetical protein
VEFKSKSLTNYLSGVLFKDLEGGKKTKKRKKSMHKIPFGKNKT